MDRTYLLLSLGHNSSAVLIQNGEIVAGYEEERFSGIKSDSAFPERSITECLMFCEEDAVVTDILISHWFLDGELPKLPNKYYDPFFIASVFNNARIMSVNQRVTHHDAHAYSTYSFFDPKDFDAILVADGFGTMGEVISVYTLKNSQPLLAKRYHGFQCSLGLMYQYTTGYLSLSELKDEYKLLGYAGHITEEDRGTEEMREIIDQTIDEFIDEMGKNPFEPSDKDPVYTIEALGNIRLFWFEYWTKVNDALDLHKENKTIVIAYMVQAIIEGVVERILEMHNKSRWILTGGIFMNVKLNNEISKKVNRVGIMPLCGDQGAPLGLYNSLYPSNPVKAKNLLWGKRSFESLNTNDSMMDLRDNDISGIAGYFIRNNMIVNIVNCDAMEYGARALGSTSTLALPTAENVEYINMLNKRSTIMPMAGVLRNHDMEKFHSECEKIVSSMEYMICTRYFNGHLPKQFLGAAHYDPDTDRYTGRTQSVSRNNVMFHILNCMTSSLPAHPHDLTHLPMIINTSFNNHGEPIAFSKEDVYRTHEFMKKRDHLNKVVTIFYSGAQYDRQ